MAKRRYSDDERANALAALAANAGNVERTARELGVPYMTLAHWAKAERHPEATKMGDEKKAPLADLYDQVNRLLLGGVTPAKVKQADVAKLMTAAGIATDKAQLLRGKPTSINHDGLTDAERVGRIAAILDAGRSRRNGHAADGVDAAAAT